jgi:hypothetical protein
MINDDILIDDIRIDDPKLKRLLRSGSMQDDATFRRFVELMVFNKMAYILDGYFELVMPWDIPDDPYIRIPDDFDSESRHIDTRGDA